MSENQSKSKSRNSREKPASRRKRGKRGGRRENEREKRQLRRNIKNRISLLLDPSYRNQLLLSECSDKNIPCAFFLKGYCKMNSSCTFRHDEEARAKKWEKEKTGDKNGNENVSEVQKKTGEKNVNENVSEVMKDDDSNQAKNDRNHGQGGQGSGGLDKGCQGSQKGTRMTGIERNGRDTCLRNSSASTAGSAVVLLRCLAPRKDLRSSTSRCHLVPQAQTPGNFSGQVYHALTPGVLGSNDNRGISQGVPPSGQAGWGNMSMPINHEYQRGYEPTSHPLTTYLLRTYNYVPAVSDRR